MASASVVAAVAVALHVLAAVVWIGGAFFALMALRPASLPLEPGPRLALWTRTLNRFFAWVIASIVVLLITGFGMIFVVFGGFAGIGLYVNLMMAIGIVMMLAFFHIYFAPFRRLRTAVGRGDLATAARQLNQIRWLVTVVLILGLITIAIGSSGRYWG